MSDLRSTLFNVTKNVTKSSGDLLKTAKMSVKLANEQEQLKNVYIDIGKKVHEIYLYGGTLGKFFDEKYREIDECERKINELKEQINQVKGTRDCVKCGKTMEKTSEFCPKCGARQDGVPPSSVDMRDPAMLAGIVSPVSDAAVMESVPASVPAGSTSTTVPPKAEVASEPVAAVAPSVPEDTPPIPPVPELIPQATAEATRKCSVCGAVNDYDTKFCLSCGRIL